MSTKAIFDGLKATWKNWSVSERIRFSVAASVCALAIGGVVYWSSQPEYVLLADQLSPARAHESVAALESAGIGYQLGFSGSSIFVARSDVNRSRLALRDVLPEESTAEAANNMTDFWPDPETIQQRQTRDLETRLAQSISQLRTVKSAKVHITPSKASPFIRDRQPTKASVILDPAAAGEFHSIDTQAIVALMANGVEGLDPSNVSILDTAGHLLSSRRGIEATINSQMEFRSWVESSLAAKAESMLTPLLGANKSLVRVTADLDFTELAREQTTYDPDAKVKLTETIRTEETSGGSSASGAAGSPSNMGRPLGSGATAGSVKKEDIDTTFENGKTVDSIRELPGKTKRLTIAAVVELPESTDANAAAPITKAQIEGIIKQAAGFSSERGDTIEVIIGKLQEPTLIVPVPTWQESWSTAEPLIRAASLGIGALVALVLGTLLIRRITPVTVQSGPEVEQILSLQKKLDRLQEEIRNDPAHVSEVMSEWLNDSDTAPESSRSETVAPIRKAGAA